jgi:hypothetical protein
MGTENIKLIVELNKAKVKKDFDLIKSKSFFISSLTSQFH